MENWGILPLVQHLPPVYLSLSPLGALSAFGSCPLCLYCFFLCLAYNSTQNMEAWCFSQTLESTALYSITSQKVLHCTLSHIRKYCTVHHHISESTALYIITSQNVLHCTSSHLRKYCTVQHHISESTVLIFIPSSFQPTLINQTTITSFIIHCCMVSFHLLVT
jgi:hypothetical protein